MRAEALTQSLNIEARQTLILPADTAISPKALLCSPEHGRRSLQGRLPNKSVKPKPLLAGIGMYISNHHRSVPGGIQFAL